MSTSTLTALETHAQHALDRAMDSRQEVRTARDKLAKLERESLQLAREAQVAVETLAQAVAEQDIHADFVAILVPA